MRFTIFLFFFAFVGNNVQAQSSFFDWSSNPDYSYAKVYLYNLHGDHGYPILPNGVTLSKTVFEPETITLNREQSDYVISIITGEVKGEPDSPNACFIPHHGIVFYDEGDNPVAHISVCLYCEGLMIYPTADKPTSSISLFKAFFEELEIPVFKNTEDYRSFYYERKANNPK